MRFLLTTGSVMMFLGVAAGAFGAHGLSVVFLRSPELESTFQTAVRYHLFHGLALFVAEFVSDKLGGSFPALAGYLFIAGIILFSGSLYLLVLTRARWLGAITPIGGLFFLAGWALLAFAALSSR